MRENKMNTKPLFLKLSLAATLAVGAQMIPMTVQADILNIGSNPQVLKKANMPKHGDSMRVVSKKFGTAQRVKTSKGKVTKRNPKITRWDYSGFTVFFENAHVIHSVVHR
jgi:hypothetical protein